MTLEASERVAKIVQSLKSFARLDQPELEWVDLHEGIESVLTLMDHLIKDRIHLIKNYGELPKVKCYASQINQVFANVLTNAVEAIDGAGSITITTKQEEPDVVRSRWQTPAAGSGRNIWSASSIQDSPPKA